MREMDALRYEPTEKQIRAMLGDRTVIESSRAMLVWEPKRIVPTYAVPIADITGEISATPPHESARPEDLEDSAPRLGDRVVLDPSIPFSAHTTDGQTLTICVPDRSAAAFQPSDPALADYVILDFGAFDAWYEEDERIVSHPRDPFHRIDILHSSRHVRVEVAGVTLAESATPYLLFEPPLPTRYYLPAEHVRSDLLQPSETRTFCAYKGEASYWSGAGQTDLAWTYRQPLRDATEITGRIAFFNERVDLVVDDELLKTPITPWSPRPA
jgi:uncharacterized protein (DUF427 family)